VIREGTVISVYTKRKRRREKTIAIEDRKSKEVGGGTQ